MTPVTSNVYERVLEIETELGSGTAFTITHNDSQYLVTAGHLLQAESSSVRVTVGNRLVQRELELDWLPDRPSKADIAVAPLRDPLTPDLPLPATFAGMSYSQELFFLGYPYGLALEAGAETERLPFVKRATLSASARVDGIQLLYLDGLNNPGFSGGPVVGIPLRGGELQVCGVVSGYRTEKQPVRLGTQQVGTAEANTGILVATQIMHVIEAIEGRLGSGDGDQ